jgi:hypothetical protein
MPVMYFIAGVAILFGLAAFAANLANKRNLKNDENKEPEDEWIQNPRRLL